MDGGHGRAADASRDRFNKRGAQARCRASLSSAARELRAHAHYLRALDLNRNWGTRYNINFARLIITVRLAGIQETLLRAF